MDRVIWKQKTIIQTEQASYIVTQFPDRLTQKHFGICTNEFNYKETEYSVKPTFSVIFGQQSWGQVQWEDYNLAGQSWGDILVHFIEIVIINHGEVSQWITSCLSQLPMINLPVMLSRNSWNNQILLKSMLESCRKIKPWVLFSTYKRCCYR